MRRLLPLGIGVIAVGFVALALAVWLYPTHSTKTTVSETSTTRVEGGNATAPTTTRSTKTTTTTQPGDTPSATMPALLLGIGVVLMLVAAFWSRILEIGLPGGGSIKLKDAEAPTVDLDDVAKDLEVAPAAGLAAMTSLSASILAKAQEVYEKGTGVVPVDLGQGDKWLLPNLYFLALVFERWTRVEVLVFTKTTVGSDTVFVACTTPRGLREQLDKARPEFVEPGKAATAGALGSAGAAFFTQLDQLEGGTRPAGSPVPAPVWVDEKLLLALGSDVLIRESVEVEDETKVSRDELLRILAFPHRFVPITRKERLVTIVDPTKLSRKLASSALD